MLWVLLKSGRCYIASTSATGQFHRHASLSSHSICLKSIRSTYFLIFCGSQMKNNEFTYPNSKGLNIFVGFDGGMRSHKHSYAWNTDACDSVTVLVGASQGCFVHCSYRTFTKTLHWYSLLNRRRLHITYMENKLLFWNRSLGFHKFLKAAIIFSNNYLMQMLSVSYMNLL